MGKLTVMPNIGVKLEEQLIVAGITTPEELRALGSREAWLKLRRMDPSTNLTKLYSLEGAILGIRWHVLDEDIKRELKAFAIQHGAVKI